MNPPFKMIVETSMEKYRYETWDTKEPETIEWIKSFKDGEIFCDVGANIGIYTLYVASLYPNSLIYAIEPDRRNYIRLLENITLNHYMNCVCFNLGLSNESDMVDFYVPKIEIGASGGQLRNPIDETGKQFKETEKYLVPVMDFGSFIRGFGLEFPEYVKIDVDGQETDIILELILSDLGHLESILIEYNKRNKREWKEICEELKFCDFTTDNPFNKMENHSRVRRAREGIKAENIIFTRR